MQWSKLSSSISYFINKSIWDEDLLLSNDVLLDDYISIALQFHDGVYYYLDKKSYELIPLTDSDMEKIKSTFLERIEKKKIKYADEIELIKLRNFIKQSDIGAVKVCEGEKYKEEFKVIEFPNKNKK